MKKVLPTLIMTFNNSMLQTLLTKPYHIIDILPDQVPKDSDGQFFAVEKYYRMPKQFQVLRRRFAAILLKLNCYYDLQVCFIPGEEWETNPQPLQLADRLVEMPENGFMRILLESEEAMIDIDGCDTYMTIYGAGETLLLRVKKLAEAEGLFVRQG